MDRQDFFRELRQRINRGEIMTPLDLERAAYFDPTIAGALHAWRHGQMSLEEALRWTLLSFATELALGERQVDLQRAQPTKKRSLADFVRGDLEKMCRDLAAGRQVRISEEIEKAMAMQPGRPVMLPARVTLRQEIGEPAAGAAVAFLERRRADAPTPCKCASLLNGHEAGCPLAK